MVRYEVEQEQQATKDDYKKIAELRNEVENKRRDLALQEQQKQEQEMREQQKQERKQSEWAEEKAGHNWALHLMTPGGAKGSPSSRQLSTCASPLTASPARRTSCRADCSPGSPPGSPQLRAGTGQGAGRGVGASALGRF